MNSTRQKNILLDLFQNDYKSKNFYPHEPILNEPLGMIYLILVSDGIDFSFLMKWLAEPDRKVQGTDTLFFKKINGTIKVEYSADEDSPPFIMSKEHFKDMIEQWVKKVENRRPPRVIIYWDDGKVRIETQDNWWAYVRNFFFNLWHRWKMKRFNKKMRKQQLLWQKKHEK